MFTIAAIVAVAAGLMVTFGISTTAVATLLGGAGIGIGFSTQQISQRLYFNRPFKEGDWISTDGLEGVEEIGWCTFERAHPEFGFRDKTD